jgi:hypothetical protein
VDEVDLLGDGASGVFVGAWDPDGPELGLDAACAEAREVGVGLGEAGFEVEVGEGGIAEGAEVPGEVVMAIDEDGGIVDAACASDEFGGRSGIWDVWRRFEGRVHEGEESEREDAGCHGGGPWEGRK